MKRTTTDFKLKEGFGFSSVTILCLQKPLATLMFFLGFILLGVFSWRNIPVELLPTLEGERLYLQFSKVAASPESIERDILIPIQAKVKRLSNILETKGEINGSRGFLEIKFEAGTDLKVRALELQNIIVDLRRTSPKGTLIEIGTQNFDSLSRFVMSLQITGVDELSSLRDIVDVRVRDFLIAVQGVSRAVMVGAGQREVSIALNIGRCTELGLSPADVVSALENSFRGIRSLGYHRSNKQLWQIVLDSRVTDLATFKNTPIDTERNILLHHIAEVTTNNATTHGVFRVDGKESVGVLVFKDEGANLVETGQALMSKIEHLNRELHPFGIQIHASFDASSLVGEVLSRLKSLALIGFIIALFVLYAFLKQVRAVFTVAIAVPISLLIAGAFLFLAGQSLNIITLFGLSIGIGMLVDNSVVVYEAVLHGLERGMDPQKAALSGVQRTMKAIVSATATNVVVLLPLIMFVEDSLTKQLVQVISAAILLPLLASLLVASTLVPLMAREMAKPKQSKTAKSKVAAKVGSRRLDLGRELFAAILKVSLRNPAGWGGRLILLIIPTFLIAIPLVFLRSIAQPAPEASEVGVELELSGGQTIDAASHIFSRVENLASQQPGVNKVESHFYEDRGNMTVYLDSEKGNPGVAYAQSVRRVLDKAVGEMAQVQFKVEEDESGVSFNFEQGNNARIAISGQEMETLYEMAEFLAEKLDARSEIARVSISSKPSPAELSFTVDRIAAMFYGLEPSRILNNIGMAGREGQRLSASYSANDGSEIPVMLRQTNSAGDRSLEKLDYYRIATDDGLIPLDNVLNHQESLPELAISHSNGRRELSVYYRFAEDVISNGLDLTAKQRLVDYIIDDLFIPSGYEVTHHGLEDQTNQFSHVYVPVLVLLFVVLTLTFESLTLPLMILLAIPMTLVGSVWGLFFGGFGLEMMALVGVIVLFGLAVNPAILLIERIQQNMRRGYLTAGGAVMMAVRERVRPVLVTTCTTVGGLWPMAIVTGTDMEIWPAFAAVLMGGVIASAVLTLIVIPSTYVFVNRFERSALALSRWQWGLWVMLSVGLVIFLVRIGYLVQPGWQIASSLVIVGFIFALISLFSRKKMTDIADVIELEDELSIESRYIGKTYDQPGLIARTWQRYKRAQKRNIMSIRELTEKGLMLFFIALALLYLTNHLYSQIFRIVLIYISGLLLCLSAASFYTIYRPRLGPKVLSRLLFMSPWIVLTYFFCLQWLLPRFNENEVRISVLTLFLLLFLTLILQYGRRCAVAIVEGRLEPEVEGRCQWIRNRWRRFCLTWVGADIRSTGFTALRNVNFNVGSGMIGLLGPNGAGKSTFLRIVASVLTANVGTLRFYGRDRRNWGSELNKIIGYLPQDFGLYNHMTAREYLEYFATLYRVGNRIERQERIDYLLQQVGLEEKQHDFLGGFSGGMRQRAAIARTLLRLSPILVVDEPTVGLDSRERIRFRNLLAKLAKDRIVLFSTHVVEDVAISCNRALVLNAGEIVYDGSPKMLASVAEDKVWIVRVPQKEVHTIEQNYKVITQISEASSTVRLRLLSSTKPHPDASIEKPTLEDGYLCLLDKGGVLNGA